MLKEKILKDKKIWLAIQKCKVNDMFPNLQNKKTIDDKLNDIANINLIEHTKTSK